MLPLQTFTGGCQVRASNQTLDQILHQQSVAHRILLVSERKVYTASEGRQLCWFTLSEVCELTTLQYIKGSGVLSAPSPPQQAQAATPAASLEIYSLGFSPDTNIYSIAIDVTSLLSTTDADTQMFNLEQFVDLRSLLSSLPPADIALAGHAVALSQWHQTHKYCPRCGAPTVIIESGAKRQCIGTGTTSTLATSEQPPPQQQHKLYPRTDAVIIALITSPDGTKALLGRSKNMPRTMLTCLSGFVDQAESIEEAVLREVKEESGVVVTEVSIVGSQPWPIGRGGSCELMIGCIGRAVSEELNVNYDEMDKVRWVSRNELSAAVERSIGLGGSVKGSGGEGLFHVPPPFAIAHHLMVSWLKGGEQQLSHL